MADFAFPDPKYTPTQFSKGAFVNLITVPIRLEFRNPEL